MKAWSDTMINKEKIEKDRKELKNLLKLVKQLLGDMESILDTCKTYDVPYLTPAFENVVGVCKQLIKDIEILLGVEQKHD
jgi:hypothetical protein